MTNSGIVQQIADGYKVAEIAKKEGVKIHTVQKRIYRLKEICLCKTAAHLVANYLRKGLIE